MNRREFFTTFTQIGTLALLGLFTFLGCEKKKNEEKAEIKDPCNDLRGVSDEEIALRKSYKYVEKTPFPEKNCKNCDFWIEPEEGKQCGGCDLFEGPIHANAYCDAWAEI